MVPDSVADRARFSLETKRGLQTGKAKNVVGKKRCKDPRGYIPIIGLPVLLPISSAKGPPHRNLFPAPFVSWACLACRIVGRLPNEPSE